MRECSRPGCPRPVEALGLCRRHYDKMRFAGKIASGLVDAAPVRTRIAEHAARGRGIMELTALAGVTHRAMRNIAKGATSRVRIGTVRRVMAVSLPPTSVGTRRRYRALARIGHSRRAIAAAGGIDVVTLKNGMARRTIPARVSLAVAAAFDALSGTPGDCKRAAANAARLRWAPPSAYDDDTIDDPHARPIGVRRGWRAA